MFRSQIREAVLIPHEILVDILVEKKTNMGFLSCHNNSGEHCPWCHQVTELQPALRRRTHNPDVRKSVAFPWMDHDIAPRDEKALQDAQRQVCIDRWQEDERSFL
jgi:hypothetical protein